MNDVEVAQRDVAHERRAALVAQQEDAGAIAPQDGVLHNDAFDIALGPAQLQTLHGDAVVVRADEAIGDQHVL